MSDNQALRQIQARPRPRLRGTLLARAAAPHAVPRADDLSASQVHQSELDESSQETVCHQTPQRVQVPPGWPSVGPHPPGGVQTLLGSFDPTIDGGVLLSNAVLDIPGSWPRIQRSVHQNRRWTSSRTRSTRMAPRASRSAATASSTPARSRRLAQCASWSTSHPSARWSSGAAVVRQPVLSLIRVLFDVLCWTLGCIMYNTQIIRIMYYGCIMYCESLL